MFTPKTIAEYDSKYSGHIYIKKDWPFGNVYISTGPVTQSGWVVKEVWSPALKKVGLQNKTWLILGVAGATIPNEISRQFHPKEMVGVEIDPVMIQIAKMHFGTDSLPYFRLIKADAKTFVKKSKDTYDYVLVDMYYRDLLPSFVYEDSFVKQIKRLGKTAIFNHLYYQEDQKKAVEKFLPLLEKYFSKVELVRKLANLLIICS